MPRHLQSLLASPRNCSNAGQTSPPPNANMAAANAQIGIATAAYYPNLTLSAQGGFESSALQSLMTWPSRFWSVGPSISETIFDAGLRRATVNQFVAVYNADVAAYRQTVLIAFQQVEDNLAAVRILSKQIQQQEQAVQSANNFSPSPKLVMKRAWTPSSTSSSLRPRS